MKLRYVIVLEAFAGYWRHAPYIKRLTLKSVPDGTTRLAMLRSGDTDLALFLDGPEAQTVTRDPRFTLVATRHASIFWIEFADQWDPKSPWHDRRLRLAVNYALDRKTISEAACLGYCPPAGVIVPRVMDFALQVPPLPYDPQKARQLLAEAGYPRGFDAGEFVPIPGFSTVGEAALNGLNAVGIRMRMRPMERAAFYAAWQEKKLRGLFLVAVGNSILTIAWHLLSDPGTRFTDLGPYWHDHLAPLRRKRQLIAELERLMGNVRTAMTDRQWDKVTAACNELADTLFYLEDA